MFYSPTRRFLLNKLLHYICPVNMSGCFTGESQEFGKKTSCIRRVLPATVSTQHAESPSWYMNRQSLKHNWVTFWWQCYQSTLISDPDVISKKFQSTMLWLAIHHIQSEVVVRLWTESVVSFTALRVTIYPVHRIHSLDILTNRNPWPLLE
jgi:hypothetical protein